MNGKCSQADKCNSAKQDHGCAGCGFQHFERIMYSNPENETIELLGKEYFDLCSAGNRSLGGRIALDKPLKSLIKRKIPQVREISPSVESFTIDGDVLQIKVKYDCGLEFNDRQVFIEVKGYGDNTNDLLSAITAAQLLKEVNKTHNVSYYYLGISSGKKSNETGLRRSSFFDPTRIKLYPYVKWAESKGLLKFYGIVDIDKLIGDARQFLLQSV